MHNSQNSASSKASFASTVLAQAILLDIPTPSNAATSNEIQAISNSIVSKIEQKTNASVSEAPTFHPIKEEKHSAYGLPLSEVVATFARRAKSIYERFEISSRGKLTLEKADKFGIEYDPNNIDFLTLLDKVQEFEKVIARAEERGINWKHFGYHTITTLGLNSIEQIVGDEERDEEDIYRKHSYLDFAATRGLEA
jgi:hypothetical protein